MSTAPKQALSRPDALTGELDTSPEAVSQPQATSVPPQTGFSFAGWVRTMIHELRSPRGWKLGGEIVGGILLAWSALLAVMTYHSAHLVELKDGAERSYYQLVGDLAHSSSQVRIGATFRVPQVMLRRVPVKDNLGPIDSLWLTLGGKEDTVAAYHQNVQQIFRLHLQGLNVRNTDWSLPEVKAAIEVLRDLGPDGWYDARVMDRTAVPQTQSLAWLWKNQHSTAYPDMSAATLLEGVKLDGISFQGFELTGADLQGTSMKGAILKYAHLADSNLQNANLEKADISSTDLKFSVLDNANLTNAYIVSATSNSARFRNTVLRGAFLGEIDCSSCNFLEADLEGATLGKANLRNAYLQNASLIRANLMRADLTGADLSSSTLTLADFSDAILDSADLGYATASRTRFCNALLRNADLKLADLRGADFTGAKDLRTVRDWTDANIANTIGLDKPLRLFAIANGAVELPADSQWKAYKQAGRPKGRWRDFLTLREN